MKKNNTLTYIGIALILIIGLIGGWQLTKAFTPDCPEIKSDTIQIKHDTAPFQVTVFKWLDQIRIHDTVIQIKEKYIDKKLTAEDTINILADYFDTKFDTATIVNDSLLWFKLNFGITQNRLISSDGKYFIKKPQTIITNTVTNKPVSQIYIGTSFGANLQDGFIVSGRITLLTKKSSMWGLSVDYIPTLSKRPMFSLHKEFKISL